MKMIAVVVLALVAIAVAAPPEIPSAKIVRSEFKQDPDGGYSFGFASDDKIERSEVGEVKEILDEENKPHKVVVVRGSYSYTNNDGTPETINYYADQSGFHPDGPSVPKVVSRR